MALVRIDEAKTKGYLGKKPALEVALAFSALVQGLVSMYRANRFSSEKQFRALYRVQVSHCLEGFSNKVAGRSR
jgi:hypothetical protein